MTKEEIIFFEYTQKIRFNTWNSTDLSSYNLAC